MKEVFIGLDLGSVSANVVVMDDNNNIIEDHYIRTKGQPLETALQVLEDLLSRYPQESIKAVATTGSGGKLIAPYIGASFTNEVIVQTKGIELLNPEVKTIIEMGGEDAKLILVSSDGANSKVKIEDFQMNSVCAAGTGSFLDQQATRMGLTIEEFGTLALKSKNPPRIAGRCSVFAKSDMIHLQQVATPDYDIVAGLCYAVARNFKATIGKGKDFLTPVSFQGGVAANLGVRKAFKDILELDDANYIIPKHFASMGAIGAVGIAIEQQKELGAFKGVEGLAEYIKSGRKRDKGLEQLAKPSVAHPSEKKSSTGYSFPKDKLIKTYLGIDVGSTSTNVILIDENLKVVAKRYLPTAGRPIEAVRTGLSEVSEECGDKVEVIGVGTTGSGRYLTGDFVGADTVRNEITAQATAASVIDPTVDTIFEIGGQDSKYIALKDGVVVDFEMNKVCAAGTGSFLEEQAERIGISIKGEFSDLALGCSAPASMGERCTVFIESDMIHHQQKGAGKDELVAGLSYSIVHNYLNKVVGGRRIGDNIFFQGGTAANLGVVSAFEKVTGKRITVPEHHDVTGAIGAAMLAMKEKNPAQPTRFKGFDLSKKQYELSSFECVDCSNVCEIRKVVVEGEEPLYYGSRCEKFDVDRGSKKNNKLPDLFQEREKILFSTYKKKGLLEDAPVIGLPRILYMYELYPFWKAFFNELGYKVVLSAPTNKEIIKNGMERVLSETCFPIKVSHGHIHDLIKKGVKRIFLPSIVNLKPAKEDHLHTQHCPYVQALPYTVASAFDFESLGVEALKPVIHFNQSQRPLKDELVPLGKALGRTRKDTKKALAVAMAAQDEYYLRIREAGERALKAIDKDDIALVIVGRPYNTTDKGINLELPKKLKDMGVLAIPFDMLPVDSHIDDTVAEDMYWKSGQKILATAKILQGDTRLYAIYLTNFGCGPDSFITHFFKDLSKGKPFLQLEIDEHSADAGAITRCEAFMDSLRNVRKDQKVEPISKPKPPVHKTGIKKKLYLPYMADGAYGIQAAFQACGIDAEIIPEPDEDSLKWGRRYTSGRECFPCTITTGDMIKVTQKPDFDPDNVAFFMPSGNGPCRFGQYNRYHRMILDELGFKDVPVYAPDQDASFYSDLGMAGGNMSRLAWWGIVGADLLEKRLREVRPYEVNPGESEKVYWEYIHRMCDAIRQQRLPQQEMADAKEAFRRIKTSAIGGRPIIGVVGEIYVRNSRFSNKDLIKKLEALGAEVRMPGVSEWIYYTNFVAKKRNWQRGNFKDFAKTALYDIFQKKDDKNLEDTLNGDLRGGHEPRIKEIIELAKPYIHHSFEGEAVLSIGKAIDQINKGASGIVNAMPFTCMPGTVVNTVLKKVREEHNNIPYLNMVYEGLEDTNSRTRMEAFVHQAKEFMERK